MDDHSIIKAEMVSNYFATWFSILSRVNWIQELNYYDLLCGPGIYDDGNEGSPIRVLKQYHRLIQEDDNCRRKNIKLFFNDLCPTYKVKAFCEQIGLTDEKCKLTQTDFTVVSKECLRSVKLLGKKGRSLIFIDPWGYKMVDFHIITELMALKSAEIILFLPVQYIYRCIKPVYSGLSEELPGYTPSKNLLLSLFGNEVPNHNSREVFTSQLRNAIKSKIVAQYGDFFQLQSKTNNHYALFFFTNNQLGFEKMLEEKWRVDPIFGQSMDSADTFFETHDVSNYSLKLRDFLSHSQGRRNESIREFSLQNSFLPKQTRKMLKKWQKEDKISIQSLDDKEPKDFYLTYNSDRAIVVKWRNQA